MQTGDTISMDAHITQTVHHGCYCLGAAKKQGDTRLYYGRVCPAGKCMQTVAEDPVRGRYHCRGWNFTHDLLPWNGSMPEPPLRHALSGKATRVGVASMARDPAKIVLFSEPPRRYLDHFHSGHSPTHGGSSVKSTTIANG